MRKLFNTVFFLFVLFSLGPAASFAQKKKVVQPVPAQPTVPRLPKVVAIDGPGPLQITFNQTEMKFGSQGVGVQSCMYVKIKNNGKKAIKIVGITSDDPKDYTIPSPSEQMFPVTVQADVDMTISVCFKPEKLGEFKSRLVARTESDSVFIPLSGKGIKAEDIAKLPKNDVIVTKSKKKKGDWNIKLQLINPSKVTMQLFDELGNLRLNYYNGEYKNEGVYESTFDGFDKDKKKLAPGKYYIRCIVEDTTRGVTNKITKVVAMKG